MDSHPYELNGMLDRNLQFSTDPIDGVDSVRVLKLRLSVKGMPRRRITLEADPQADVDDIYNMLDEYLDEHRLPTTIVNVTQAGLKFTFDPDREDLPKSLSFDLSWPNSSNLKSKPEQVREIGEKYLKQWGLDRAASPQDDQRVA